MFVILSNIWLDNEEVTDTFLELLEPYILKDMLGSLPPEIMQVLVEHYSKLSNVFSTWIFHHWISIRLFAYAGNRCCMEH
nr:vacuolar protein sorting-associated protein 8 homolog isoform X1 [Ipomoea batatas]GME11806.1 vacuolar protein sorting-associated protein 8 homolog isoform X1 [Ipomoea batatas]GME20252.1 vacuolar protein sorting-associated protein 8 homolog isoform X1 [Ipomoea batatas]